MKFIQYFKIWLKGTKMVIAREMTYPSQFFLQLFARIVWGIVGPLFALIVYNTTSGIPGWTFEQILLFYGTFNLSLGIAHTLFLDLAYWIPLEIETGIFDKYLIRPMKLLPLLLSTGFSSEGPTDVIVGLSLVIYAISKIGAVSFSSILIYSVLVGISVLIWFGIILMIIGLSFIFVRTELIWNIFDTFIEFVRYPLTIYSGSIQFFLTFLIPLGIASFYPASFLLGLAVNPITLVFTSIAAFVFFGANYAILNYGLRRHTSAGG